MNKNKLKIEITPRGFSIINFKDTNGNECSLQKSSSADEDKIWLGMDNQEKPVRMHLNQEQVKELLPFLKKFIKTGNLQ